MDTVFSGDKPHICKLCHKRFALPCNLKAHLKLHHTPEEQNTHQTSEPQPEINLNPEEKPSTFLEQKFKFNNMIPDVYRNMLYEEFQKNLVPFRLPYMFPTFEHNLTFHLNQSLPQ